MSAYKLKNGNYLYIERVSAYEAWDYTIFDKDGKWLDGGELEFDNYPNETTVLNDLLLDMELERTDYEQVPVEIIDEFMNRDEEDDFPDPADLEMGFDPYLGCYTDDC